MDRNTVLNISRDLDRALEEVGRKHGVKIQRGALRYDHAGFTGSITCKTLTESGITELARTMCAREGLDPNSTNPRGFKIVDYNRRAHTRPWIVQDPKGKLYKLDTHLARFYFARRDVPEVA